MKHILLLALAMSLSFAMDRNIVLGSYSHNINAQEALNKAVHIINQDTELAKNIHNNESTLKIKKIGDFDSVIITNLKNYREVLHTLDSVHKHYKNAYIVPPYRDEELMRYRNILKKEAKKSNPPSKRVVVKKAVVVKQVVPLKKKVEVKKIVSQEMKKETPTTKIEKKPTIENIMNESEVNGEMTQTTSQTTNPIKEEKKIEQKTEVAQVKTQEIKSTHPVVEQEPLHVKEQAEQKTLEEKEEVFKPTIDEGFTSYQLFLMALIGVLLLFVIVSFILSTRQKS